MGVVDFLLIGFGKVKQTPAPLNSEKKAGSIQKPEGEEWKERLETGGLMGREGGIIRSDLQSSVFLNRE